MSWINYASVKKKLELKFAEGRGNKEKISNELAMIHAHRKKGLELLKQLKKEQKQEKQDKFKSRSED